MAILLRFVAIISVLLSVSACERPPVESEQLGFRGTAMQQVTNPRLAAPAADVPAPLPAAPGAGPAAGAVYQNVQVLGDLPVPQFTRLMQAMTNWVAPEEGCNYCHVPGESLADDTLYTKVVSRRMLEMTLAINDGWSDHVGATGVTCYTCHRGNNVPEYGWFRAADDDAPKPMVGYAAGQKKAAMDIGSTSMHYDPFTDYLGGDAAIRGLGERALPNPEASASIQATEKRYSLMSHMSDSLGINCTFCHNSRAFGIWEESSPARVTAWHGLEMVSSLNAEYLESVEGILPPERLGKFGDVKKVSCMTCHQGASKPLNGASMLADYPELTVDRR